MELQEARYIAEGIVTKLRPTCERIMICGSIRRHQKECSDIDLVVIPRLDELKDMFKQHAGWIVNPEFVSIVNSWTKIKGDPTGKYTQRLIEGGHKLEISIANPNNFGCLVMIRTGDADFSHLMMKRVRKMGYEQREGHLYDGDKMIPVHEEDQYFHYLNLPVIDPVKRDAFAFKKLFE